MEIKRDFYLDKLIKSMNNGMVKILSGIRRCGKSYLLDPIFKDYLLEHGVNENHIIKIDLDSIENEEYTEPRKLYDFVMSKIVDEEKYYILLDEIQEVKDFEKVLNSFLRKPNLDVYVTGSNSRFLSKDIITEFRGRGYEIKVYPLSYKEVLQVYDKEEAWNNYYMYGGLPLTALSTDESERRKYIQEQTDYTYLKDVVDRNNIQNDEGLKILIQMISSSVGSLTNPTKLENTFKSNSNITLADKTIYSYLQALEDAFIIEKAQRYDVKGKKYIDTPYKYYFTDIGVRNYLINYRQIEENHLMENLIYIELKRRGYSVDVGVVESRTSDERKNYEVDFVCNYFSNRFYIQSALNVDTNEKLKQEENSLLNINDSFKKMIIVKDDIHKFYDENGILILGIKEFLTDESLLEK